MITITVLYIITVSFSFYFKKDFGYTMILIGLITLIAYPTYYKQSFKERLRTQLRDYVSNKFDIEFTIVLTEDYLRSFSEDCETK
jgi:c-di-AMP phosphodiesterase-like protein